jgi:DNA-binding MarR family transcriptional regulator
MSTWNVNYQEMMVISALSKYGEESINEISETLNITVSRALHLIRKLKNKHLIITYRKAGEIIVRLTRSGKSVSRYST